MALHKKYKIATIGSHSALQILKGAHDEGFSTIAVCKKGREKPYKIFKVADKIFYFCKRRRSRRTSVTRNHQRSTGISVKCASFQIFVPQPTPQKSAHKRISRTQNIQHLNRKRAGGNRCGGFRRKNLTTFRTTLEYDCSG